MNVKKISTIFKKGVSFGHYVLFDRFDDLIDYAAKLGFVVLLFSICFLITSLGMFIIFSSV